MKIATILMIGLVFIGHVSAAVAQSYSAETRQRVTQFPNDGGTLDWQSLSDALQPADVSVAFDDVYVSTLIGLRTGRTDVLDDLLDSATATAEAPQQVTKVNLLKAFLEFYLSQPKDRTALLTEVLNQLDAVEASGASADWVTGTAIGALSEHALQINDLAVAKQASSKADYLFSRQPTIETAIWSANINIKSVYAAMPSPAQQAYIPVNQFLSRATNYLNVAHRRDRDETYTEEIVNLYYRTITLNSYLTSRIRANDDVAEIDKFRRLRDLHPKFETDCVVDWKTSRRKIRSRILSGTGGVLLRLVIDKKGRAKFLEVEDAVPARLAHEKVHRSYRTMANEMRVTLKEGPECRQGGEVLYPVAISGER